MMPMWPPRTRKTSLSWLPIRPITPSDWHGGVMWSASATLRHITGLDVLQSSAVVKDGKITEYHVNVKIAFVVEPADISA